MNHRSLTTYCLAKVAMAFLFSMQSWQPVDAFVVNQRVPFTQFQQSNGHLQNKKALNLIPLEPATASFSTLVVAADQSWRQYVSLVVIAGVLIDILLGSPLANTLLKPMRPDGDEGEAQGEEKASKNINRSKERIDTDAVAQAAIDRATNTLELRRFLDERKTDWDRMEDMKRKMDAEMQDLDDDLQAREEDLSKRRNPK
jgi:hypothetical protein